MNTINRGHLKAFASPLLQSNPEKTLPSTKGILMFIFYNVEICLQFALERLRVKVS